MPLHHHYKLECNFDSQYVSICMYALCIQILLDTCYCEMEKSSNHGYHDVAKIKGNPGDILGT